MPADPERTSARASASEPLPSAHVVPDANGEPDAPPTEGPGVPWLPWGEDALARARLADRIVIVSSVRPGCAWCAWMDATTFRDPDVQTLHAEHLVSVRIDAIAHPSLDRLMIDLCQLVTRTSGWPVHVFLTPAGLPFHACTWHPRQAAHGRRAWADVVRAVVTAWRDRREEVEAAATDLRTCMERRWMLNASWPAPAAPEPSAPCDAAPDIVASVMERADLVYGGFGEAPKFPSFPVLRFLAARARAGDTRGLPALDATWREMLRGAILDPIEGGLFRFAGDGAWTRPCPEKSLAEQGMLLVAAADTAEVRPALRADLERIVAACMEGLMRAFGRPDGGWNTVPRGANGPQAVARWTTTRASWRATGANDELLRTWHVGETTWSLAGLRAPDGAAFPWSTSGVDIPDPVRRALQDRRWQDGLPVAALDVRGNALVVRGIVACIAAGLLDEAWAVVAQDGAGWLRTTLASWESTAPLALEAIAETVCAWVEIDRWRGDAADAASDAWVGWILDPPWTTFDLPASTHAGGDDGPMQSPAAPWDDALDAPAAAWVDAMVSLRGMGVPWPTSAEVRVAALRRRADALGPAAAGLHRVLGTR